MPACASKTSGPQADPREFSFGYGRRICPGRYFAEASAWITIATALSLFTFERVGSSSLDSDGNAEGKCEKAEMIGEYESGMVAQFPKPFRIRVKVRQSAEERLGVRGISI